MRLLVLLALLIPAAASAQTGAIVTVELRVFAPGVSPATGTPIQTTQAALNLATCNTTSTAPPAPVVVANPVSVEFDDPTNAGKVCRLDRSAFFGGLPVAVGQYRAALAFGNDVGQTGAPGVSADSFLRLGPVLVPANVRIRGGSDF